MLGRSPAAAVTGCEVRPSGAACSESSDRLSSSFNITEVKHVGADLTNGKADVKLLTFFSASEIAADLSLVTMSKAGVQVKNREPKSIPAPPRI
jgi:hypothetical protein